MDTTSIVVVFKEVSGAAVAIITAVTGAIAFAWAYLRPQARHLGIIDLATKRLMFWDQFLKTAASAVDPADAKYQTARDRAYDAILNVADQADGQLQRLSWDDRIRQLIREEGFRFLIFKPGPSLSHTDKAKWYLGLFYSWLLLIAAVLSYFLFAFLLIHSLFHPSAMRHLAVILLVGFTSNLFAFAAGTLHFNARKLNYIAKYPRPKQPIFNRI